MTNKILIITYYWPPGGGAGVQRWLKFVKYFRDFGIEPVVYTPLNPELPATDQTLADDIPTGVEVIKRKIREPYSLYKKLTGKKSEQKVQTAFLQENKSKSGLLESLSVWIRGNLFIPDARKYWIRPSVKFLEKYISDNKISAVVTTGPPHSMHLIGLGLKKRMDICWLADFRDPWTNIDYYRELKLSDRAHRMHQQMEFNVLNTADVVTVISPGMRNDFEGICERDYHVIPNGYDAEDMKGLNVDFEYNKKFVLSHIGSLTKTRNPKNLWKALDELCKENISFKAALEIRNIGKIDFSVTEQLKDYKLDKKLKKVDYLSHDKVLVEQRKSDILLLLINDTPNANLIMTSKLFEYLAAERPIVCIGPENGDAARIVKDTNTGVTFEFSNVASLKSSLLNYFNQKQKEGSLTVNGRGIDKYERKNLTRSMAELLNGCINHYRKGK